MNRPLGSEPARKRVMEDLAHLTLSLGRTPHPSEVTGQAKIGLKHSGLSFNRALTDALRDISQPTLAAASSQRKAELTRYFAMQHFASRTAYRELDPALQRDIKAFFGTIKVAQEAGRKLLFSTGDITALQEEASEVQARKLGRIQEGDFILHIDDLDELTPRLRTYVAIGEMILGSLEPATLLGLHIETRKLSLYHYPDFQTEALPRLALQTLIDFRSADVRQRDHSTEGRVKILLGKSDFMSHSDVRYDMQTAFEAKLSGLLPPEEAHNLPFSEIAQRLLRANLSLPY